MDVHRILFVRPGSDAAESADDADLPELLRTEDVFIWVDISPPADDADNVLLRDVFRFHPLAIEDCFESREHPKIDEYADHLYLTTHGLTSDSTAEEAYIVELDAFVASRYLVTFHSEPSRSVTAVIDAVTRIGLPLKRGPVSTLHAILDRQTDGMEEVLDRIADRLAHIEEAIFTHSNNRQLAMCLNVKRNILHLRRWMAKQREVMLRLGRREFRLVGEAEGLLFRDLHDHLVRNTDTLDTFREMLGSIQEAYLSVVSNRLNEVMKFLTTFTAVLMPLTVITGIYGMNFEHMPELRSRLGYPVVLGIMAVTALGMLFYFRRRGWVGRQRGGLIRRRRIKQELAKQRADAVALGVAALEPAPPPTVSGARHRRG